MFDNLLSNLYNLQRMAVEKRLTLLTLGLLSLPVFFVTYIHGKLAAGGRDYGSEGEHFFKLYRDGAFGPKTWSLRLQRMEPKNFFASLRSAT
jgi:hypothetical protein